ncbi:hypothetical protein H311_02508 [Anncaliia algerae PRA109]|nr:hypothetical protein H311_02508 [Anncaliia algerae PRA109]
MNTRYLFKTLYYIISDNKYMVFCAENIFDRVNTNSLNTQTSFICQENNVSPTILENNPLSLEQNHTIKEGNNTGVTEIHYHSLYNPYSTYLYFMNKHFDSNPLNRNIKLIYTFNIDSQKHPISIDYYTKNFSPTYELGEKTFYHFYSVSPLDKSNPSSLQGVEMTNNQKENTDRHNETYEKDNILLQEITKERKIPNIIIEEVDFLKKRLKVFDSNSLQLRFIQFFNINEQARPKKYIVFHKIIIEKILEKFNENYYNAITFYIFLDFLSQKFKKMGYTSEKLHISVYNHAKYPFKYKSIPFSDLLSEWTICHEFSSGNEIYDMLIQLFKSVHMNLSYNQRTIRRKFMRYKYRIFKLLKIFLS